MQSFVMYADKFACLSYVCMKAGSHLY